MWKVCDGGIGFTIPFSLLLCLKFPMIKSQKVLGLWSLQQCLQLPTAAACVRALVCSLRAGRAGAPPEGPRLAWQPLPGHVVPAWQALGPGQQNTCLSESTGCEA